MLANYKGLENTRHDARGASPEGGVRNCQIGKELDRAKPGSGRVRGWAGLNNGDEGTWGDPPSDQDSL
jgi:hypothetical protein